MAEAYENKLLQRIEPCGEPYDHTQARENIDTSGITAPDDSEVEASPAVASRQSAAKWVGPIMRRVSPAFVQDCDDRLGMLYDREHAKLPEGLAVSEQRLRQLEAMETAAVDFAALQGVVVTTSPVHANADRVRFYGPETFVAAAGAIGANGDGQGFATPLGHVAIRELADEGSTLIAAQHELLHDAGARTFAVRLTPAGHTIDPRRSGIRPVPGTFDALSEGLVVAMTRDIKKQLWPHSETLANHTAAIEPGIQRTQRMPVGEYDQSVVYGALFEVLAARASEITGSDVTSMLYADHFRGSSAGLRLLSRAYGNRAVTILSRLDPQTVTPRYLLATADEMNIAQAFVRAMEKTKVLDGSRRLRYA